MAFCVQVANCKQLVCVSGLGCPASFCTKRLRLVPLGNGPLRKRRVGQKTRFLSRALTASAVDSRFVASVISNGRTLNWQRLASHPVVGEGAVLFCSFIPVVIAYLVSRKLNLGLESELLVAILRATAQLTLLGFALKIVFGGQNVAWTFLSLMIMVLFAGQTAGDRARPLPQSFFVATLSLIGGALGTIGLMVLLKVLPVKASYLIATTGFVVGNCMSVVGWTLKHLYTDIRLHRQQIEAALALGATPNQAVEGLVQKSLAKAMGPMIDYMKISGLITLPGSMTGMLMTGASPLEAVRMQLRMLYMLMGAASLSSVIASTIGWQCLFNRSCQLAEMP